MKKDILWNSLGTAAWSFLSLFLLIVVTRINGLSHSGLFSFAFAVAFITFSVACYGGRAYQVSDHHQCFHTNSYISLRILTSIVALSLAGVFVIANGYDWQKSLLILLLVSQRVIDAFADVFYGVLQKNRRLYISGQSLFFKSLISFFVFLAVDILTKDLLLAVFTLPLVSVLFTVFYDIPQSRKLEKFAISLKSAESISILHSTFLPFAVTALSLIFVNIARYFIDIFHPNLQGYFGILVMPLSLITLLFSFVYTPAILQLTEHFNNCRFAELRQSVNKIIAIIFATTLVLGVLAYLFGTPFLKLLFGTDFSQYHIDIVLVVLIGSLVSLSSLFSNIAIVARKLKSTSIVFFASNILLVALCLLLVRGEDVRGAVTAYVLASTVQALAMGVLYLRLTRR